MTNISVIIPTYNGLTLLKENLPTLLSEMDSSCHKKIIDKYEIIIVDDCSRDGSYQWLKEHPATHSGKIKVVVNKINSGFSHSVNEGVKTVEFKSLDSYLLLLNNDIKVTPDFLKPMLEVFENNPDKEQIFAVSNKAISGDILNYKDLTKSSVVVFRLGLLREKYIPTPDFPIYGFGASGGHALFNTEKFLELGGFDEKLFSPFYWEDADLAYRAWKNGFVIYYQPQSKVIHQNKSTIGKLKNWYVSFIFHRNYFTLHWKNLTDGKYIFLHLIFLPFNLTIMFLKNPMTFLSFISAVIRLPLIIKSRRKIKKEKILSDEEVFKLWKTPLNYL